MAMECRVCGADALTSPVMLRETMYGSGAEFEYLRCEDCGCLQIADLPSDMAAHYPANYYSYGDAPTGFLQTLKSNIRIRLALDGPAWAFAGRDWWENGARKSVRDAHARRSDRVLDIGCGSGDFLRTLSAAGFQKLLGADPYIADDIRHPDGVKVLKREASGVDGPFELVMMHHSLEHAWDQRGTARELYRLLAPGGHCIIRIPTIDCWAWEEYGRDWVQLDAPRHFYLHSRASITRLLESAGLKVTAVIDDSSALQILGSEKIRRGLPLIDAEDGGVNYERHLEAEVVGGAPARARTLNAASKGDSIAVHAVRPER